MSSKATEVETLNRNSSFLKIISIKFSLLRRVRLKSTMKIFLLSGVPKTRKLMR